MKKASEVGIVFVSSLIFCWMLYWSFQVIEQRNTDEKDMVKVVENSDRDLAVDGTYEAILIYFHSHNEICEKQTPIVHQLARKFASKVKVASINCTYHTHNTSNTMYLNMFNVHTTPTFVLRLKGQSAYRQWVDFHDLDQLENLVNEMVR